MQKITVELTPMEITVIAIALQQLKDILYLRGLLDEKFIESSLNSATIKVEKFLGTHYPEA